MFGKGWSDVEIGKPRSQKPRRLDLGFDRHEPLHLGRLSPKKLHRRPHPPDYAELVNGLCRELHETASRRTFGLSKGLKLDSDVDLLRPQVVEMDGAISELSELDDEAAPTMPLELPQASTVGPTRQEEELLLSQPPAEHAQPTKPMSPDPPPPIVDTPQRITADQILASMNAMSPSPPRKPRHTLSLAERTRLSMARRGPQAAESDDNEEEIESPPVARLAAPSENVEYQDLAARTRKSMAGFDAARQKAQMERRRSQRKSRHGAPARGDAASQVSRVDEEGDGDTTLLLAESLLATGGDDEEAVFKSRPKVQTSPLGTWEQ
jgi:hypothetical protein